MVERMWPTCIGLATFGELKSMTIFFARRGRGTPSRSSASSAREAFARASRGRRRKLMNPAPAISGGSQNVGDVELGDDLLRELARIRAQLLREDHGDVRLVIAEARIGRGGDLRIDVVGDAGKRGAERAIEERAGMVSIEMRSSAASRQAPIGRRSAKPEPIPEIACSTPQAADAATPGYGLRGALEDAEDFLGGRGGAEALAHGAVVEELRDRRQRAQVRLKLIFRHDEKDDEFHRRIIERVELDPRCRAPESGDHFVHAIGRGVRDGDAETDAGAHRLLALAQRGQHDVAIRRALICPCATSRSTSSTMADHRSVACISGRI